MQLPIRYPLHLFQIPPAIKERMTKEGSMMIGFNPQRFRERVNFFRIIVQNMHTTESDLDFAIAEIERLGKDL